MSGSILPAHFMKGSVAADNGRRAQGTTKRLQEWQNISFKIYLKEMRKVITDLRNDKWVTTQDSNQIPPNSKSDILVLK
jgi:hypothetical protein